MRFKMQKWENRMKKNMEIRAGPLCALFLCTNIIRRRKEDLNDERIYYVTKQQYVLQNCDD